MWFTQEFVCELCSFQTNDQKRLEKHINLSHVKNSNDENKLPCHACGEFFDSKDMLMMHRKNKHSSIVKKCNWFRNGSCSYTDNMCWYSHDLTSEELQHKCRFCGNCFNSKSELMAHRKSHHSQTVAKCRNYVNGKCNFGLECWYEHGQQIEGQSLDFQEVKEMNQPPDMTPRMLNLMEKMMQRMSALEKMIMRI